MSQDVSQSGSQPELTRVFMERCPCGHELTHRRVRPDCKYSWWGYFGLIFGSWGTPKRVDMVCADCHRVMSSSTDPAVRLKHK